MELATRHAKVKSLFLQARELPDGAVCSFLNEECAGDDEVRQQVERLLMQDTQTDANLLVHVPEPTRIATGEVAGPRIGVDDMLGRVGSYRLVRKLGEGGMGTVFEAEQPNPKRLVALKVMRAGRFASDYTIKLFEREIQALARLRHPGIAHIHEAGCTEDGHHFFTMELAGGQTLSAYLKTRRLTPRESIALCLKICDAVTYAHQHGVIHRDLKPSNIMVHDDTGAPGVKVLDFGLARIHDDSDTGEALTQAGSVQGTLPYMSPEQVTGIRDAIDIRTDVYALGVILYEMLAGRLPLELAGIPFAESVRLIQEEQPQHLRKVSGLDADLCTIVHKALEKDPDRRYSSSSALSEDLRRYLANEPIHARPPSTLYELRKLVARRKLAVGFAATLIVLIVAFAVSATVQARRIALERDRSVAAERIALQDRNRAMAAEAQAAQERNRAVQSESEAVSERNRAVAERKRADAEADTAKAISEFLQRDLLAQAQAQAQAGPNTKPDPNLPVRTALERAAAKIDGRFSKQPTVEAAIRYTIGTTQWNLGLLPAAEQQLEKALEIRRRVLGDQHLETLASTNALGLLYFDQGKYAQAEPLLVRTLELRKRLLGEEHADTSVTMNNLGRLYRTQGKLALAEALYSRTLQIRRRVLGEEHPSTAIAMNNLGFLYYSQGKFKDTEPLYLKSLEIRRRALGEDHPTTATARLAMGLLYHAEGRYADAEPMLAKAFEIRNNGLGEAHADTLNSMANLALCYLAQQKLSEADTLLAKVVEIRRKAKSPLAADAMALLADVRIEQQRYSEASPLLREACGSGANWNDLYCRSLRGAVLAGEKQFADAEPLLVSGYEGLVQQRSKIPPERLLHVVQAGKRLVQFYQEWGNAALAAQWQQKLQSLR